jgi:hypothetical protein
MRHSLSQAKQNLSQQVFASLFTVRNIVFVAIALGTIARFAQYFANRSLWRDEAKLALNIVNRSYLGLLQPLDDRQGAPIGFLLVEKLATQLFGNNEYALRLFPLLCGILSLALVYELGKRFLSKNAIPVAVALVAGLTPLIYYSSELKQYSSDVACALLGCLIGVRISQNRTTWLEIVTAGIVGAILVWFSHPAIFTLAGVATVTAISYLLRKEYSELGKRLIAYSFWAFSFIAFYFISLSTLSGDESLKGSWGGRGAFMPFPPTSLSDLLWFPQTLWQFFANPVFSFGETSLKDVPAIVVAIPAFLIGCIFGFKGRKVDLLFLLSPILLTLFASGLEKYPFKSRLVLFLVPFAVLILAEGLEFVRQRMTTKPAQFVSILLVVLLLAQPVSSAGIRVFKPILRQEIKPVIGYVQDMQQRGDVVYVYHRASDAFRFYASQYGFQDGSYIIGVDDLDRDEITLEKDRIHFQRDLDRLRGKQRVWVIYSHYNHVPAEKAVFDNYLNQMGKELDLFQAQGAMVALYDLS